MVAAVLALCGRGAAELAGPEDERVLQEARALQIGEQAGDGQVHLARVLLVIGLEVRVLVPLVAVRALDEAHAGFGEAAREQALPAEVVGGVGSDAVEIEGRLRFAREVHHAGCLELHAEGELEGCKARLEGRIGLASGQVLAVEIAQEIELGTLRRAVERLVLQVSDRRPLGGHAGVADRRALKGGRQEGRRPVVHAAVAERRADRDEARQVLVLGAEAVQ